MNATITSLSCALALAVLTLAGCGRRDGDVPAPAPPPADVGEIGEPERDELSYATLSLAKSSIAPGGEVAGEIVIALANGWHTYGDPPGDSGMPPIIDFSLPEGWHAEVDPLPPARRFEDEAGVTFGYEDELRIAFRLQAPAQAEAGKAVDIVANVQWLICKEICLPRSDILSDVVVVNP